MKPECLVCFKDLKYSVLGRCNHSVTCLKCSFLKRSKYSNNLCVYCRSQNQKVFVFDLKVNYTKFGDGGSRPQLQSTRQQIDFDFFQSLETEEFKYGIHFARASGDREKCMQLKEIDCPFKNCPKLGQRFLDLEELKHHLKKNHQVYYCDECLVHSKSEDKKSKLYLLNELQVHKKYGDFQAYNKNIFFIKKFNFHPYCFFCKKHFYDGKQFQQHLYSVHFKCNYCVNEDYKYIFYENLDMLKRHYHRSHYVCKEEMCSKDSPRVFSSPELLCHHTHKDHKNKKDISMSKVSAKISIGEMRENILWDSIGRDFTGPILQSMKDGNDEAEDSTKWSEEFKPIDIIKWFRLLIDIKSFEYSIFDKTDNKMMKNPNQSFLFYENYFFKKINQFKKPREIIQSLKIQKNHFRINDKNTNKSKLEPFHIEDIIFFRWVGKSSDIWICIEEECTKYISSKDLEDLDYLKFEYKNNKMSSEELFEEFLKLFSIKYSFRVFYFFGFYIQDTRQKSNIFETLGTRLKKLGFRNKGIVSTSNSLKDVLMKVLHYIFGSLTKNKLNQKRGSSDQKEDIFDFNLLLFDINVFKISDLYTLKYLKSHIKSIKSLNILKTIFFLDKDYISLKLEKIKSRDLIIGYFYFVLIFFKYENKESFFNWYQERFISFIGKNKKFLNKNFLNIDLVEKYLKNKFM